MNIKNLIKALFITTTFIVPITTDAQMPKAGTYVQQSDLHKLEGKWQATRGNETLTIKLTLQSRKQFGKIYTDAIIGWHDFQINGVTVSSTFSDLNNDGKANMALVSFYLIDLNNGSVMSFGDPNRRLGYGKAEVKLLDNNTLSFKIKSGQNEQIRVVVEGKATQEPTEESRLIKSGDWILHKMS
ncbi:DUF6705 family protein [Edaphocola aurantiacus]|uniref:DUF6705 family protein n=1 Tax=Edaphocola aurantiacus TaxID=2601682 RepID=UPI001C94C9C3|nr:DUF6705 family protein [Edaphocola aurantiacus]